MNKKIKKGFTLVELVIVIAVIAILAAVLIPTFAGILQRAKENSEMQTVSSLRDEILTTNYDSIGDMENLVMEYEGKLYKIGANGTITKLESQNITSVSDGETIYSDSNSFTYGNVKIYTPQEVAPCDFTFRLSSFGSNKTATLVSYDGNEEDIVVPSYVSLASSERITLKEFDSLSDLFEYFGAYIDDPYHYYEDDYVCQDQIDNAGVLHDGDMIYFNAIDSGDNSTQIMWTNYTTYNDNGSFGYDLYNSFISQVVDFEDFDINDIMSALSTFGDIEYYIYEHTEYYSDYYTDLYCDYFELDSFDSDTEQEIIDTYGEKLLTCVQIVDALDNYIYYCSPSFRERYSWYVSPYETDITSIIYLLNDMDMLYDGINGFLNQLGFDISSCYENCTFNYQYEKRTYNNGGEYKVTSVASKAFKNSNVKTVYFPDTITSISSGFVFQNCPNLTSIRLSSNVTSLSYFIDNCPMIEEIVLPDTITSVGSMLAQNCENLTRVKFSDGMTTLTTGTFGNCPKLEEVILPANLTRYCTTFAHTGDTSITSLVFPTTLSMIDVYLGDGMGYLNDISFVGGVTENDYFYIIDNCLIRKSDNTLIMATNTSVIPNFVTTIGSYAYLYLEELTSVHIPASVTLINSGAFMRVKGVTTITVDSNNQYYHSVDNCLIETATNTLVLGSTNSIIPDYVTTLGYMSFTNSSITSIDIPVTVTKFSLYTFSNCTNLTTINYAGTTAQWNSITKQGYWNENIHGTIVCTNGNLNY